jgi:hypothetical protein
LLATSLLMAQWKQLFEITYNANIWYMRSN